MKERPILFNGPMVRALLDDSKTKTRRVMKPQMVYGDVCGLFESWYLPKGNDGGILWLNAKAQILSMCPYGQPGDKLWVRETFQYRGASYDGDGIEDADWFRCYGKGDSWDPEFPYGWGPSRHMNVRAMVEPDEQEGEGITGWVTKRIPSIHMPRWASRITLEIVSVRVEQLQDISEADALAEGIDAEKAKLTMSSIGMNDIVGPIAEYSTLWESINGPSSWAVNPWVWVVEFKRIES